MWMYFAHCFLLFFPSSTGSVQHRWAFCLWLHSRLDLLRSHVTTPWIHFFLFLYILHISYARLWFPLHLNLSCLYPFLSVRTLLVLGSSMKVPFSSADLNCSVLMLRVDAPIGRNSWMIRVATPLASLGILQQQLVRKMNSMDRGFGVIESACDGADTITILNMACSPLKAVGRDGAPS